MKTIIDGSVDKKIIHDAVTTYMEGLSTMAFPNDLKTAIGLNFDVGILKRAFQKRLTACTTRTDEIIYEINTRATELSSERFQTLQKKDKALWQNKNTEQPLFGVLICVDKGVPAEAIGVDISNIGRVLAGDIEFSYIPSKHVFFPAPSALIKRLIHYGRQGKRTLVEPLIEHTSCGRRAQILANEGHTRIPSLSFIFDHIDVLASEFSGNRRMIQKNLTAIATLWRQFERIGPSVVTPDAGLYTGIIQKIAQRQALSQLHADIRIVSPIEVYEKDTGNLYAGLDRLDVLTDKQILKTGGFTREMLTTLAYQGRIFSLKNHADAVFADIQRLSGITIGSRTYTDLQTDWLSSLSDMIIITETIWQLYEKKLPSVREMVVHFFRSWSGDAQLDNDPVNRRIIHHLFHMCAYAYVLDTLNTGHMPGKHHIEHYLATGDHEMGTKPLIALGQGDLDRPDVMEMFTGYSVLLHSDPGHEGKPIPVTIKLDTDRSGNQPMSTEETNVALDDLGEFLKLWPYFIIGDMIPILMVRGKAAGGVSRLGLSVLKSLGDIAILYQQSEHILPRFVPAVTSAHEVVLVPAKNILEAGASTKTLSQFRRSMTHLADRFSDKDIQRSFAIALS